MVHENLERLVPAKECHVSRKTSTNILSWRLPIYNDELAHGLECFVLEIRKKDGAEYSPNSLHHIVCGIMRHVRST